jgi:hypothetical protein
MFLQVCSSYQYHHQVQEEELVLLWFWLFDFFSLTNTVPQVKYNIILTTVYKSQPVNHYYKVNSARGKHNNTTISCWVCWAINAPTVIG